MNKINKMLTSIIVELPFFPAMVVKFFGKFRVTCPCHLLNSPRSLMLLVLLDLVVIIIWPTSATVSDRLWYLGRRVAACVLRACMEDWKYWCSMPVFIDKPLWNTIKHKECWIILKRSRMWLFQVQNEQRRIKIFFRVQDTDFSPQNKKGRD